MAAQKPWKKILYEIQGYPDNYVDSSFLDELRKNLNVRHYEFSSLACESCVISQQLACVCALVTLFLFMKDQMLTPECLWFLTSSLTLIGYFVNFLLNRLRKENLSNVNLYTDVKTCLLFQGYSGALSSILVSLTETISTDTVYAMTTVMLMANLFFCNYHSRNEPVPGASSLNAAIFASVCLASRLHTPMHAFATVTAAFELFALWPLLCRKVKEWSMRVHVIQTMVTTVICASGLYFVTPVGAVLYLGIVFYVTLIAPAWFVHLQPLKNNIHGPWDEAVVLSNPINQQTGISPPPSPTELSPNK